MLNFDFHLLILVFMIFIEIFLCLFENVFKFFSTEVCDFWVNILTFDIDEHFSIWATTWQNLSSGLSNQVRLKLACSATEAS